VFRGDPFNILRQRELLWKSSGR